MAAPNLVNDLEDTSLTNEASIVRYGQSKLANILHARSLNTRYGPSSKSEKEGKGDIWTSSVHPRIVQSGPDERALEMFWYGRLASSIADAIGARWPADRGAWTPVYCAASHEIKVRDSGEYLERIAKVGSRMQSAKLKDMELAEKLERWVEAEMKKRGIYLKVCTFPHGYYAL